MFIKETFINETEGYRFGSSDWHETFTDDLGRLYRDLKAEYGNAQNMYRDGPDGRPVKVGWVFTGRSRYEDTHEPYIRSVWVKVSQTRPVRRTITSNVTSPWDKAGGLVLEGNFDHFTVREMIDERPRTEPTEAQRNAARAAGEAPKEPEELAGPPDGTEGSDGSSEGSSE